MPKLYVIMDGLVSVATPPGGNAQVLLIKTYPKDLDALNQPLMPHFPRVSYRTGGRLAARALNGEDIKFITGQPPANPKLDLSRLPSFSQILAFAPPVKGGNAAISAQINAGCLGGTPGTACLVPGKQDPRLAARVLIDQGFLTSIQVDDNGNPFSASPVHFQFLFLSNTKAPAFDMSCDNALLLKADSGTHPIQMKVGTDTITLDNAVQSEKDLIKLVLGDPEDDCVIVRITDMVDPMMAKQMKKESGADVHFPIFFDLLTHYTGSRVIPTLVNPHPGDQPLSRCIPPKG
jgi:hypothetical protein